MAPRDNNPRSDAESTVFGNLGLDADDLGLEQDTDLGEDQDDSGEQDDGSLDTGDNLRESNTQRQQQQRQKPPQRQFRRDAEVKPDGKGNLVDAAGKVVAKAGAEARLYQSLHQTRQSHAQEQQRAQDLSNRLNRAVQIAQELQTQLTQFQGQQEQLKQFGIKPEEQLTALQMFAELRSNPTELLKKLLTRAAASGINLQSLGLQSNATDPKALVDLVKEEIGKAVKPLDERTKAEQQQREREDQQRQQLEKVNQEVNSFFASNPDAREYMPVFHQVLSQRQFAGMSLGEIWARIQLNLLRNGQQRPNSQNRRSLPAGRRVPQEGNSEMAPVNATYDSILKDVLAEHNIK